MNGLAGNPARGARDPRPPPPRNGGGDIARRRERRAAQTMRGAPNRDRAALTSNVMHR
ncbi:hypothetical protein DO71_3063 [Burkholderia pseudomallei]|uniref:hypothetical protein n=1 Tax=Burkholderia pseudomallei TaxID=28450 RepID=UPI00050DBB8C|nr:hypothetical protein [Burkholderia pseudomallei]KGC78549.1 hypothetical protein DO71_3063 [Burkholderia pseudomallei]KGV19247.1 hypothetical protein X891_4121 [Burkholderia pseudomallei TSV 43]KGV31211.1 hypothetical protein X893_2786 [Burkholderia pseudomallei TSV 31]